MTKDFMVHDMLKIFLVEDEVVIRNGIKNNIPWEREGFIFAGEASDGELAYPLIIKAKPDILITDIKMPFMDGLELSRIVRKELPQIRIIILSGYNEFDYAKSAIEIGVTQYLLKPISSAKLLEAVKEVGALIEKEREQDRLLEEYRKEMNENLLLERQKLWNALIANELSAAEFLENGQFFRRSAGSDRGVGSDRGAFGGLGSGADDRPQSGGLDLSYQGRDGRGCGTSSCRVRERADRAGGRISGDSVFRRDRFDGASPRRHP